MEARAIRSKSRAMESIDDKMDSDEQSGSVPSPSKSNCASRDVVDDDVEMRSSFIYQFFLPAERWTFVLPMDLLFLRANQCFCSGNERMESDRDGSPPATISSPSVDCTEDPSLAAARNTLTRVSRSAEVFVCPSLSSLDTSRLMAMGSAASTSRVPNSIGQS